MGIKEDTPENRSFLQNVSDENWYDLHGSTQYAYVQLARKIQSREGVDYLKRFKIGPKDGPVILEEKRARFWASRESAPTSRRKSRRIKKESSNEAERSSDKASVEDEKGSENTELSAKFIEQTIQVMNLQKDKLSLEGRTHNLEKDKLSLEERVRNLENSLEEMRQEQFSYKEQISTMQQEQKAHKKQISQLQKNKVDLASQLFDAKHRIEVLEKNTHKLHKEIEGKNKFIESHLAIIARNTNELLRKQDRRLSL